jgi:cobalt/nickel transport system permease protein
MRKNRFIGQSLSAALSFIKESVLSDEIARRRGLLQMADPRMKIIALLSLIGVAICTRDIRLLAVMYASCCLLALLSRISLLFFLMRTWVFIPAFAIFIVIPSLFSVFTPGEQLAAVNFAGAHLVITRQGLSGAVLFVSRVLVTVSLAVLVTITTRSAELFAALRWLRVPKIFVMILSMCYRYIFLFTAIIQDMFLAVRSRTGGAVQYRKGQKIVAWNIAALWQKAVALNRDVYNAMLSRGYTGEPRSLRGFNSHE